MKALHLLLWLCFCEYSVYATSPEKEEEYLSPLRRRAHSSPWRHHQSCGEYYMQKSALDVEDITTILKLLEAHPHFNLSEPSVIVNDDLYCLKAYFEYAPSNYTTKELEVINSKKELIGKGQYAFITSFRPAKGTLGKQFHLTLTIIEKQIAPYYEGENNSIKLLHRSTELNEDVAIKEKNDFLESTLISPPPLRKKRSFSLSRLKGALSPKSESPRALKKEKEEISSPASSRFYSPLLGRIRSPSSPTQVRPVKELKAPSFIPAPNFAPINLNTKNQKSGISKKLHKSKSYPELKSRSNRNVTPLSTRTVKERIQDYENLSRASTSSDKSFPKKGIY